MQKKVGEPRKKQEWNCAIRHIAQTFMNYRQWGENSRQITYMILGLIGYIGTLN